MIHGSPEIEERYRQRNGYEMTYTQCRARGHDMDDWGDCTGCGAVPSMDDRMADMIAAGEFDD